MSVSPLGAAAGSEADEDMLDDLDTLSTHHDLATTVARRNVGNPPAQGGAGGDDDDMMDDRLAAVAVVAAVVKAVTCRACVERCPVGTVRDTHRRLVSAESEVPLGRWQGNR